MAGCGGGSGDSQTDTQKVVGHAPQVAISSPGDNSTYVAPSAIDLVATASDAGGTVTAVEFFADGGSLGQVTAEPYTIRWLTPPAGPHVLTAIVHDNDGNITTSAPVDVIIDAASNRRPSVVLASPAEGSRFTQPEHVMIDATAFDADGQIQEVDLYVGAYPIATCDAQPCTFSWDAPAGEHTLSAVAIDDDGALGSSAQVTITVTTPTGEVPVNSPPTVSLTQPLAGAVLTSPVDVAIAATASDIDGSVVSVDFYADDSLVGRVDSAPFMVRWTGASLGQHTLKAVALDDGADTATATINVNVVSSEPPPPPGFTIDDERVGDADLCYTNPEFSDDDRYVVWGERLNQFNDDGEPILRMWHCQVDSDTGALIPADCKGFSGFDSTSWGRAYMGHDRTGVFYLGANADHQLTMTRITGAHSGTTTVLGSLVDPERRAIYPSVLPDSDKIYAYWLKSHGTTLAPEAAEWVELRYVDIDDPTNEVVVDHQVNTEGLVPMDVTFPRWVHGEPLLDYGHLDDRGRVNLYQIDVSHSPLAPVQLTDDAHYKAGPFPIDYEGRRYIVTGVDGSTENYVYREPVGGGIYDLVETFMPPANETFATPCLANSNEPFIVNGKLFTSFQITNCENPGNVFAFLSEPGEIWFAQLLEGTDQITRVSLSNTDVRNEPEPVVGSSTAWVFYTAYPSGQDETNSCSEIRRAATPAALLAP